MNRLENGREGNSLPSPVALVKVPSYPVEHRVVEVPATGELQVILSQYQFTTGQDVSLTGGHVMVSIQHMSQGREHGCLSPCYSAHY